MGIMQKVNEGLLENNGLDRTIINPFFGKIFQSPLRNLRCFYPGIIPVYDKDDERWYIKDRWTPSTKNKDYDRLASGIVPFYPFPQWNSMHYNNWNR